MGRTTSSAGNAMAQVGSHAFSHRATKSAGTPTLIAVVTAGHDQRHAAGEQHGKDVRGEALGEHRMVTQR